MWLFETYTVIGPIEAKTIRDYIAQKSEDEALSIVLNFLWSTSKTLHDLQNDADGTENGRKHVKQVEHNIWRLITETNKLSEFNINELFVLSAAACCHDFDKALRKYNTDNFPKIIFKHGADSADFLRNNLHILGLIEYEHLAENIARIIEIHDLNGEEFAKEVKKLKHKGKAVATGTIRHRLLAVLLKVADILHTDASRTQKLGVDLSGLTNRQKSKYHARRCIEGWDRDGIRLMIQARVTTEVKKNAIVACEKFMLEEEWPVVDDFLENHDYPHVLKFDVEDCLNNGEQPMPATDKEQTVDEQTVDDIPVGPDRFLPTDVTDSALDATIKDIVRFPICRNLASSHAAGAAVVSLAVFVMRDKLQGLKNTFKNYLHEMFNEEKGYAPRNLIEHIGWLADQDALTSRIIDEGPGASEGESVENILKNILENFPNAKVDLYKPLREFRESLKQHIGDLRGLYKTIIKEIRADRPTHEEFRKQLKSNTWENKIRRLFESKWPVLFALYNDIEKIINNVDKMGSLTKQDWDMDVNQIWDDEKLHHRPQKKKKLA